MFRHFFAHGICGQSADVWAIRRSSVPSAPGPEFAPGMLSLESNVEARWLYPQFLFARAKREIKNVICPSTKKSGRRCPLPTCYGSSQQNLAEALFDFLHIRTILLVKTLEIHLATFIGVKGVVSAKRREHERAAIAPIHRTVFGINEILHEVLVLR